MRTVCASFLLALTLTACDDKSSSTPGTSAGDTAHDTATRNFGAHVDSVPTTNFDDPYEDALLRVAHMSPDTPNVDFYIDEGDAAVLSGTVFSTATDYLELEPDVYSVQVTYRGEPTEDAILEQSGLELEPGARYTAVALGTFADGSVQVGVYRDDQDVIYPDTVRLQIINAAAMMDRADIWDVTEPIPTLLGEDVMLGDALITELPAGERDICVDMDADAGCDALFPLPRLGEQGAYNLYLTNNNQDVPFSVLHFENGTTAYINTESNPR